MLFTHLSAVFTRSKPFCKDRNYFNNSKTFYGLSTEQDRQHAEKQAPQKKFLTFFLITRFPSPPPAFFLVVPSLFSSPHPPFSPRRPLPFFSSSSLSFFPRRPLLGEGLGVGPMIGWGKKHRSLLIPPPLPLPKEGTADATHVSNPLPLTYNILPTIFFSSTPPFSPFVIPSLLPRRPLLGEGLGVGALLPLLKVCAKRFSPCPPPLPLPREGTADASPVSNL